MRFSLGRKKYTAVDIGSSKIKVVIMQGNGSGLEIIDADYINLPPEIIEDGKIDDKSIVSNKLKEIFAEMDHNPKNILTTIPSTHLITRNIELPDLEKKELEEALKWELDDVLPYSADETTFDYIITGREEETVNILLIAAKNETVDQYKEPFIDLGIEPDVINIQPMALISLLSYQNKLEVPAAIIDFGHQGTRVILADKDNLYLTRTIDRGGYDFTQNIMDTHQLDYKKAEEYKWNNGIENEKDLDSVEEDVSLLGIGNDLINIASEISEEISRSLEFYSIKNRGENIENIYVTGGGSLLKGIITMIKDETGLEPEKISPFLEFDFKSGLDHDLSNLFTVAVGLGISEVLHNES